ncbi:MAG TPA: hypothetical protein VF277_08185, partial [Steroidobacteraceae bacterium]
MSAYQHAYALYRDSPTSRFDVARDLLRTSTVVVSIEGWVALRPLGHGVIAVEVVDRTGLPISDEHDALLVREA